MASRARDLDETDPILAALARAPVAEPLSPEEEAMVEEGYRALAAGGPKRTHEEVLETVSRMRAEQGE